jgi:DNA-binding NtrC family response regulator
MKRDEKGRKIPMIIISGSAGPDVVGAKLQGAYKTFSKPYKIEELLVTVKRALGKERRNPDLFEGQTG